MPKTSAGLLPYRRTADGIEVFVAHMGGPFWARKDAGAWSIIKGEYGDDETPEEVARREFREEIGVDAPPGPWHALGEITQSGGKRVTAFAAECADLEFVASNEVEIEWPPRSGRTIRVPEVDRAEWWPVETARAKLVKAQGELLDRLLEAIGEQLGGSESSIPTS